MFGYKTQVEGNELVIRVPLTTEGKVSASGKSNVFASSEGNVTVTTFKGQDVKMGLNIYYSIRR